MRTIIVSGAPVVVLLLGSCTTSSGGEDDSAPPAPPPSAAPSVPSPPPSPSPPAADEPTACPEVRAGIDDFNAGDLEATVEHFEAAVPLAQEQDEADGTRATAALLEAVIYYAELPPQDYPLASRTSPEFAKYKQITLGQCVVPLSPDGPGGPGESEVPV